MAKVTVNDCCGCPECRHCDREKDYEIHECDECGCRDARLYYYDGQELCINCIASQLDEVED